MQASADPSALTDSELLEQILDRDQEALAALYDRHVHAAYSLARILLREPKSAEEVVQEAFFLVWRRAETYRPERGPVRSWLLSVVRNRAVDTLRKEGRRQQMMLAICAQRPPAADSTEDQAIRSIEGARVRRALAGLPRTQLAVVELAYFGGLTYPEVSARLNVPLGTVKSRMRLALRRLSTLLSGPSDADADQQRTMIPSRVSFVD